MPRKMIQCTNCDGVRIYRHGNYISCVYCGHKINEKTVKSILIEYDCASVESAIKHSRYDNRLRRRLTMEGVMV